MSLASDVSTAVVTLVVTGALAGTWRWGRKGIAWVRSRLPDDHQPIGRGAWATYLPPDSQGEVVRVLVLCAPSRSLRGSKLDPSLAIAFVRKHLHDFPDKPAYSTIVEGVRFDWPQPGGNQDYVWVNASGRLDLSLSVPVDLDADGEFALDVLKLVAPIATIGRMVNDPDYWKVFGARRPSLGGRFDWRIGVSIDDRTSSSGYRYAWHRLSFPGRQPPRAADLRPFCPPQGFASDELSSRRLSRAETQVISAFLRSFLEQNGYHDLDGAIEDVERAWTERASHSRL